MQKLIQVRQFRTCSYTAITVPHAPLKLSLMSKVQWIGPTLKYQFQEDSMQLMTCLIHFYHFFHTKIWLLFFAFHSMCAAYSWNLFSGRRVALSFLHAYVFTLAKHKHMCDSLAWISWSRGAKEMLQQDQGQKCERLFPAFFLFPSVSQEAGFFLDRICYYDRLSYPLFYVLRLR